MNRVCASFMTLMLGAKRCVNSIEVLVSVITLMLGQIRCVNCIEISKFILIMTKERCVKSLERSVVVTVYSHQTVCSGTRGYPHHRL